MLIMYGAVTSRSAISPLILKTPASTLFEHKGLERWDNKAFSKPFGQGIEPRIAMQDYLKQLFGHSD